MLIEFGAQLAILATHSAQIHVVVPGVVEEVLRADDGFFERSNRRDRPDANEPSVALLRRALNLYRQPDDLGKQNGRQHDQVAKAAKNGFHNSVGVLKGHAFSRAVSDAPELLVCPE